jgi:hypothetical protein
VGFFVEWRYFTLSDVGDGALESGLGGDPVFQREEKAVLTRTKEGRDHVDRLVEVLDGLSCKCAVHVLERLGCRVPSSSVEDQESSPALG